LGKLGNLGAALDAGAASERMQRLNRADVPIAGEDVVAASKGRLRRQREMEIVNSNERNIALGFVASASVRPSCSKVQRPLKGPCLRTVNSALPSQIVPCSVKKSKVSAAAPPEASRTR
jgi:hypothetical protein